MASQHQDPTSSMSPGQHQDLHNARTGAIGSADDTRASLMLLETAHGRFIARMRGANRTNTDTTSLPESVSEVAARVVHETAEQAITKVETASRRDLAGLPTTDRRCRSIRLPDGDAGAPWAVPISPQAAGDSTNVARRTQRR